MTTLQEQKYLSRYALPLQNGQTLAPCLSDIYAMLHNNKRAANRINPARDVWDWVNQVLPE